MHRTCWHLLPLANAAPPHAAHDRDTARDGVLASNTATVTLTVKASPPVAEDDSYDVKENNTLNEPADGVLANDYSPDNLDITAGSATQTSHGGVTLNADGSFSYTPDTGYVGSDSFTYEAIDSTGLASDPATVTIDVTSNDTPPTAGDVSYTLAPDSSLSTDATDGVLSAASDTDGDQLTATLVTGPADGTLSFNVDGSFTYTPNPGYNGTDSFTFKAFDGTSYSNVATATLTVPQDTPTAEPGDYSVMPSGTTSFTADDGVLAALPNNSSNWLTASLVSTTSYGDLTLNSDGSFSYTPGPDFTGNDSFTYEAYDGMSYSAPATVTLTTLPVAPEQSYSVTHDQSLTVAADEGVLLGAYDAESDPLTATVVTGPSNGTLALNSDGSFTYTPNAGFVGSDSFTFNASNGTDNSGPSTATIDVIDDAPLAGDSEYSTLENQSLAMDAADGVLVNAADEDGDTVAAELVSGPSYGTLQLSSSGAFVYTPDPGFVGTDTFDYAATDGISTSDPAPVTITVDETIPQTQPNSMPSAVAVADFNNDTYPDVALADQGRNTVSVYSDSSGVLSPTPISTTTVGTAPVAVSATDFGNGQEDLAVVNSGNNTVSILMGNGDGTFTTGTTLAGFNDPVALVAGDFGNGQEDLAVVNNGSNTVAILLGNGNGTFTTEATLTTDSSPTAIAAADFNNDGNLDVVVTNSGDNTVSVFLGNGDGTFQSGVPYAVGTSPMSVTTGDFDGDGNVDVAVADSGSNDVEVLLGNGDGTFQAPTSYTGGNDPVSVVAGNFAGPGYPATDLAIVNEGSSTLTILSDNSGSGGEDAKTLPTATGPRGMALGDFAHNGQLQGVVVAMAGTANAQLALVAALPAAAAKEHTKDFWLVKAAQAIAYKKFVGAVDKLKLHELTNKKINTAYAKLFLAKPALYTWLGAAAFASHNDIGLNIRAFRNNWLTDSKSKDPLDRKLAKQYYKGADILGEGNSHVYSDIYWQYLAYDGGGIKEMQTLNTTNDSKGSPMLSAESLEAWTLIDDGRQLVSEGLKEGNTDKAEQGDDMIWDGNKIMFRIEQRDIVQPDVFNDKVVQFIGEEISKLLASHALFPGATPFTKAGKNIANYNERWNKWIDPPVGGLWRDWRSYVAKWVQPDGTWVAGINALKNAMVLFKNEGENV